MCAADRPACLPAELTCGPPCCSLASLRQAGWPPFSTLLSSLHSAAASPLPLRGTWPFMGSRLVSLSWELCPAPLGLTPFWLLSSLPCPSSCSVRLEGSRAVVLGKSPAPSLAASPGEWLSRPEAVSGALPSPLLLPRWQSVCVGEPGLPLLPRHLSSATAGSPPWGGRLAGGHL